MGLRNGDGVKVGWGDKSLSVYGKQAIYVLLTCVVIILLYLHDVDNKEQRQEEHKDIKQTIQSSIDEQRITNWLLSQPPNERMRLDMPQKLREEILKRTLKER